MLAYASIYRQGLVKAWNGSISKQFSDFYHLTMVSATIYCWNLGFTNLRASTVTTPPKAQPYRGEGFKKSLDLHKHVKFPDTVKNHLAFTKHKIYIQITKAYTIQSLSVCNM